MRSIYIFYIFFGLFLASSCQAKDTSPITKDFKITAQPQKLKLSPNQKSQFNVLITRNSFSEKITLTVSNLPEGVVVTPASIELTTNVKDQKFEISVGSEVLEGNYQVTITAKSNDKTVKTNLEFSITKSGQKSIWKPKPGTSWQWQLQGDIDTSFEVDMYDIDLFDAPQSIIDQLHARGIIVICYFSAGSFEPWREDANKFPSKVKGKKLGDWNEWWLDIRERDIIDPIMQTRLDLAVSKKCDGVEPDNVDAYANNTGLPLKSEDQLKYNIFLATEAHARGLSIGFKNDLDQVKELESYFDWALNEQCFQYKECDLLLPFIKADKAVFGVEYEIASADFCPLANAMDFDFLKKDYDLKASRIACR